MFSASLGGKELFHSNLLAWMCRVYPEIGIRAVTGEAETEGLIVIAAAESERDEDQDESDDKLGVTQSALTEIFVDGGPSDAANDTSPRILREFRHIDLLIQTPDGSRRYLIENKFKSTPDAAQLIGYARKMPVGGKSKLILLCVDSTEGAAAVEAANKEITDPQPRWEYRSYNTMLEFLKGATGSITSEYHRALVDDYVHSTTVLLVLTEKFRPDGTQRFFLSPPISVKLSKLRVHDLIEKRRAAALAAMLRSRLVVDERTEGLVSLQHRNSMTSGPQEKAGSLQVYSGYSNQSLALGVHYVTSHGLYLPGKNGSFVWPIQLGVQLQGGQFRLYVSIGLDAHEAALRASANGCAGYKVILESLKFLASRVSPPDCCGPAAVWRTRKQGNRKKLAETDYQRNGEVFLFGLRFQYRQSDLSDAVTMTCVLDDVVIVMEQLEKLGSKSDFAQSIAVSGLIRPYPQGQP